MERYRLIQFDMQPVSPVAALLLSAPLQPSKCVGVPPVANNGRRRNEMDILTMTPTLPIAARGTRARRSERNAL
jgi:hypothetical protein